MNLVMRIYLILQLFTLFFFFVNCVILQLFFFSFFLPSQLGRCRFVSEFEKLNRIGEGTYGIVCKYHSFFHISIFYFQISMKLYDCKNINIQYVFWRVGPWGKYVCSGWPI